MSTRLRILRNAGIGLGVLILACVVAAIVITQTAWFQQFVREKAIAAVEQRTGGRAEIGSFRFEWTHLRGVITDFVIHGSEPPGTAPFARARRVSVSLRFFTEGKLVDISDLEIDRPQVDILVAADGSTNIPKPRRPSTSKKTPLETVVDLAVAHFKLANGSLSFNSRKQNLEVQGNDLRAQLQYERLQQGYRGEISFSPVYVAAGSKQPVDVRITLPIELQKDRITFRNARIATGASTLAIDASIESLRNPSTSAHIHGSVALADLTNAFDLPLSGNVPGVPTAVLLDVNATIGAGKIDVAGARVSLGSSFLEASGKLRDPSENGRLSFRSHLAIGEIGRLARLAMRPAGTADVTGTARFETPRNYDIEAKVEAAELSFQEGRRRFSNISLSSPVSFTPPAIQLSGFRIGALDAQLTGDASLKDFASYQVMATLRDLDLRRVAQKMGQKNIPYDGVISGLLAASGDLKAPGVQSLTADTRLTIAPGHTGLPLSGRLNADYRGATDQLAVDSSYVALPHSRVSFDGSLDKRLQVSLRTTDLNDFTPLTGKQLPVMLSGQPATFAGAVTGRLTAPQITGHLSAGRFSVEGRQFDSFNADLSVSDSHAAVLNGNLGHGAMQTQFQAAVGLRSWKPAPREPLSAAVSMRSADLGDVLALAGVKPDGDSGALNANANLTGTIGDPRGSVNLSIADGNIHGQPFDQIQAQADLTDQLITVPTAQVTAGPSRIDLAAEFQHPRDRFNSGQLHAHVRTNQVNLAMLQALQQWRPETAGVIEVNADVRGDLQAQGTNTTPEFRPVSVALDLSGRGLRVGGQNYGDFLLQARTSGQTVKYTATSTLAGSDLHLTGDTQLAPGYRTTADARITGLQIERVVQLAKAHLPVKGTLAATVHFAGPMDRPEGSLDATLTRAVIYGESIDRAQLQMKYLTRSLEIRRLEIRTGASRLALNACYDHPAGSLRSGNLQVQVQNGYADLARIQKVQQWRPGLAGALQLAGSITATVRNGVPRVTPREVNFDFTAKGLALQRQDLGGLSLTAHSSDGPVEVALDSNLGGAAIHGRGSTELGGDYPVQAQITFQNVSWQKLQPLLSPGGGPPEFDGITDGRASVNGPILRAAELNGSFQLSRLQFIATPPPAPAERAILFQNEGPIALALDHGTLRIDRLHLTGPKTDVQAAGTVSLPRRALQLMLRSRVDLGVVEQLEPNLVSSGEIVADATLRGTFEKPLINGNVELQKASIHSLSFPTGISSAEGSIKLSGAGASLQNVTADVGGGKLTLAGLVTYDGLLRFQMSVKAEKVRLLPQPGVSVVADAGLRLDGRMGGSILSGTVTIDQITYAPHSDLGSILTRAQPSVSSARAPSPYLEDMKLDVWVRTAPGVAVQASVAQTLQADANLHLVGTAAEPGMLGRIDITEGQLYFFSTNYTVNNGTISFYSPIRIEPVLNLSLQTQTKGVEVVLHVTGPVDNMKLTYTSDPPLPFQEIVGLLATGAVPTSDPTLLAQQPVQSPQNFQQMGESAVLSTAIADPIANRLQRVFGITQLKINPSFAGTSNLPQTQIALQQKITNAVTLTYATAVDNPSTEVISGEWEFNRNWSVTATRDEWGLISIMLNYKKRIH